MPDCQIFQPSLALDIGGANLKVCYCDSHGQLHAFSQRFAMCDAFDDLIDTLKKIVKQCDPTPACWLVTMTGELSDCFIDRKQGVKRILNAVQLAAGDVPIHVWSTAGRFVTVTSALGQYTDVASANWHVLGAWVGLSYPQQRVLLLDTGSTTTDLIPVLQSKVSAHGLTDALRLEFGELLYLGGSMTPLMAIGLADQQRLIINEWFANMQDIAVLLGFSPENVRNFDTPDGEPLTSDACARRLLRMVGRDLLDASSINDAQQLAREFLDSAIKQITKAIQNQLQCHAPIDAVLLSGSGSWLLKQVLQQHFSQLKCLSLNDLWDSRLSTAACGVAMTKVYQSQAAECQE
ncbi:hypothetical protein JYU15_00015 [bacterium AH-315-I18]|nr:hypothetical protein [bacterium AH-315-I18]